LAAVGTMSTATTISENQSNDNNIEMTSSQNSTTIPVDSGLTLDLCFGQYAKLYSHQWTQEKYNEFNKNVLENIQHLSRLPRTTLPTYFGAFSINQPLKYIRYQLINELLTRLGLTDQLTAIDRSNITKIHNDIVQVIYLLAEKNSTPLDNTLLEFCKAKKKVHSKSSSTNENEMADMVLDMNIEITELKSTIEDQNSTINEILQIVKSLSKDNLDLKSTINELKSSLNPSNSSIQQLSNSNLFDTNKLTKNFPPSTYSKITAQPSHINQSKSTTSISNNNTPLGTNTRKRPLSTNETSYPDNNSTKRFSTGKQPQLFNYDSYNPHLPPKPVIYDENDGYTVVKRKPKLKINQVIARMGTNKTQSSLQIVSRRQRVFIASLHPDTTEKSVSDYLNQHLFVSSWNGSDEVKNKVPFYNLIENKPSTETNKPKRSKSFTFEIDLYHRKIVEDKDLWPQGSFVDYSFFPRPIKTLAVVDNVNSSTSNSLNNNLTSQPEK
jgi:hypothetical protein